MLRDYQEKSITLIREEFKKGNRRVILHLATGAGKTTVFCTMIARALEKQMESVVVVRGRKLVDQASKRLFRENVPHGVMMMGHWNSRPNLPVQVCSIDTVISRKKYPKAKLIVVDEAHMADSPGYLEFFAQYPDAFIVMVTATPYLDKGWRHLADAIVHPIRMLDLVDQGYLVPFRYFAPDEPSLKDVKISKHTGDYASDDLEKAMVAGNLTGKIIDHWIKIAQGLPTICFAVNVKHSKYLTERFNEAGIPAEHVDANATDEEREAVNWRLESGITKIVCNVGILCTGVDIPCLGAIIMARPTKSLNLFIQQAGRGTRPFSGKENCILLDHAGNLRAHGLPTDEPDVDLDGIKKESHSKKAKLCKECFAIYEGSSCDECGWKPEANDRSNELVQENEGNLVEIRDIDPVNRAFKDLVREARKKGHRKTWAYYRLIDKFGFEAARPYLPSYIVEKHERSSTSLRFFSGSKY